MAAEASPTDNPIVIPKETLRHDSQGDYVFALQRGAAESWRPGGCHDVE
jgi:hypothetical protein